MIKRLRLRNFKGFERFEVTFTAESWLVGPNNAGKSTIIAALRTTAQMVSYAKRRPPEYFVEDGGVQVAAHPFPPGRFGLVEENLRHEFRNTETRIEVQFGSGARLIAVWPPRSEDEGGPDSDDTAYFYLRTGQDVQIRTSAAARQALPDISVIPILSPVEHDEPRLTDDYVRSHLAGRLASRHARNQLRLLQEQDASLDGYDHELAEFLDWARPHSRDFRVGDLVERQTDQGFSLDVFCRETGSRSDRELFWAGDGVQVWIQLLMHLFRNRIRDVIILDEPDLYLHADLQRRLVRLLESLDAQTIAASHSAEVLVEAPPPAVVWVSKDRRRAVRAPSEKVASELSAAIGSQFNLRLARALRASAVIFVEGDDMRMLRNVATTLGASRVATEAGIVTVPLRGFSNWKHVEPFSWLLEELLERAVRTLVILDRDYRTETQIVDVEARLKAVGVTAHVWRRKELESYFLVPSAIARRTGAGQQAVAAELTRLASEKKEEVFARILAERLPEEVSAKRHMTVVTEGARADFEKQWTVESRRAHMCNAKDLLHGLNTWLQANERKTVSARGLSAALRADEIADEMADLIARAQALAAP